MKLKKVHILFNAKCFTGKYIQQQKKTTVLTLSGGKPLLFFIFINKIREQNKIIVLHNKNMIYSNE